MQYRIRELIFIFVCAETKELEKGSFGIFRRQYQLDGPLVSLKKGKWVMNAEVLHNVGSFSKGLLC
jgi:hypothetical protein